MGVTVIYDGDCPLCSRYVHALRIREAAGAVELVDARTCPDLVARFRAGGVDLDEAFVCFVDEELYAGGDAVNILALLSGESGALNRLNYHIFGNRAVSRRLYPLLRAVRNGLLTIRGIGKLNTPDGSTESVTPPRRRRQQSPARHRAGRRSP
ncbi:MAG: DUF393 domain-containing protein [Bauldia sp.]|nr:DUF393 domain-containing protein [Bauldia sp.]